MENKVIERKAAQSKKYKRKMDKDWTSRPNKGSGERRIRGNEWERERERERERENNWDNGKEWDWPSGTIKREKDS